MAKFTSKQFPWARAVASASWLALSVACGADSGGTGSSESTVGGSTSTVPGNEAIPDIGQLPVGGAPSQTSTGSTSPLGGSTAVGGATSISTVTYGITGGTSSIGTQVKGGATSTGGTSGNRGGSTAAGGATSTGGTSGNRGGSTSAGGTSTAAGGSAGQTGTESGYHDLANWTTPQANNKNHHGRAYFFANAQKDEHGIACSSCHGSNLEGTSSAPSCNSCHSTWRSCTYCHGTGTSQINPPHGVADETAITTLAVGRHAAHLSASNSHAAFACTTCHAVPATDDVTHALGYQSSTDLSTSGHHGDVLFSGLATNMTWNVGATTGAPVTARGTCTGACHSNGRGGPPAKAVYWAGGTYTAGCTNCHGNPPNTGSHSDHKKYACSECHAGATSTSYASANHFNGKRDYSSSKMPYSGGKCSGSCHGSETW